MTVNQATTTPRANFHQARMLVVEDNPDHWTIIQAASRQVLPEVDVVWKSTGEQALAYLETTVAEHRKLPKLLLLDLYLPDAEQSWQLLRTIKQPSSPFLRLPVVVFSYSDRRDDINDFYAFGGTSYIIKPSTYERWVSYFENRSAILVGNRYAARQLVRAGHRAGETCPVPVNISFRPDLSRPPFGRLSSRPAWAHL